MPEYVNGYEVFQQRCFTGESHEMISFTELSNSLGDGYEAGARFGAPVPLVDDSGVAWRRGGPARSI